MPISSEIGTIALPPPSRPPSFCTIPHIKAGNENRIFGIIFEGLATVLVIIVQQVVQLANVERRWRECLRVRVPGKRHFGNEDDYQRRYVYGIHSITIPK